MAAKGRPAPLRPWRDGWPLRMVVGALQVLPLCIIPSPAVSALHSPPGGSLGTLGESPLSLAGYVGQA